MNNIPYGLNNGARTLSSGGYNNALIDILQNQNLTPKEKEIEFREYQNTMKDVRKFAQEIREVVNIFMENGFSEDQAVQLSIAFRNDPIIAKRITNRGKRYDKQLKEIQSKRG